jgi:hypothetical protein
VSEGGFANLQHADSVQPFGPLSDPDYEAQTPFHKRITAQLVKIPFSDMCRRGTEPPQCRGKRHRMRSIE